MCRHTFPAGVHYLGDPCYALGNHIYDTVWGAEHGFSTGKINTPEGSFVVDDTSYGDGVYYGSDGREYPVDSGTIALIPWSMCAQFDSHDDANRQGRVLDCAAPVMWTSNDGIFRVTTGVGGNFDIEIDTANPSDENSNSDLSSQDDM